MGFFDDFIVGKIDQMESVVGKFNDGLASASDKVVEGSQVIDKTIENTAQRVENMSQAVDDRMTQSLDAVDKVASDAMLNPDS